MEVKSWMKVVTVSNFSQWGCPLSKVPKFPICGFKGGFGSPLLFWGKGGTWMGNTLRFLGRGTDYEFPIILRDGESLLGYTEGGVFKDTAFCFHKVFEGE